VLLTALAAGASALARAQNYPDRPIKLVLPVSPGSAVDSTARKLMPLIANALGQPFVIDNKPGSGGLIASTQLVRSPPDGYTLGLVSSTYCVAASLYKMPFDPKRDVQPVSILSSGPMVLVAHPKVQAANLQQLLALVRSRPATSPLLLGNTGNGSTLHFAAAQLAIATKANIMHVPYKGMNNFTTDLVAGVIEGGFLPPVTAIPFLRDGRLKAIGMSTATRLPILPDVPTIAESGLPGFDVDGWVALVAPAKVPREILQRLSIEAVRAVRDSEFEKWVVSAGGAVVGSNMADAEKVFQRELAEAARVIKTLGIKAD
jgi:tripartite-type tricarboxylate transporter receptor subunit TctC